MPVAAVTVDHAPIILTATLGEADFRWADGLRCAHFPAERNKVPAHITLFHHLPPSVEAELLGEMRRLAAGKAPLAMLAGVRNLGGGVAYDVDSPGLLALRVAMADRFHGLLTPQDSVARPRLHITVQNKVKPATARVLGEALSKGFRPRPLAIAGLAAWRYRGGPWDAIRAVRFRESGEANFL